MKNKEKKKKGGLIYNILIAFFAIIAIVCIILIAKRVLGYKEGQDIYSDISNEYYLNSSPTMHISSLPTTLDYYSILANQQSGITINYSLTEELEKSKSRLLGLKEKYKELYGWLSIENTKVDYPLLQHSDNDYYLTHAPNGEYLIAGSINVDYRNSKTLLNNRNLIIYGHNLYDGNMFHALVDYTDKDFFYSHRNVKVYTFDGIYVYKIFSIAKVNERDDYIRTVFLDDNDFLEFALRMKNQSMFAVDDIELDASSKILTLSTCTNVNPSERYSIQAVLVEIVT